MRHQRGKPALLDDREQSLRRAGGLLDAPLPVADQVLRDGEVVREDRLGDVLALPDPPDLAPGVVRQGRSADTILNSDQVSRFQQTVREVEAKLTIMSP